MPKDDSKRKLLCVKEILEQHSDEEHPLIAEKICSLLSNYSIEADRRSIYADIRVLKSIDMDIVLTPGGRNGFYLAERKYDAVETRILLDAVLSSKFITIEKTKKLVGKILKELGPTEKKMLESQLFINDRQKHTNEQIYYFIDKVQKAIHYKKRLTFNYLKYDLDAKQVLRKDGKVYEVTLMH